MTWPAWLTSVVWVDDRIPRPPLMELAELDQRRAVIAMVQSCVERQFQAPLPVVELRDTPTDEPGSYAFSVTATGEGQWRADEWYHEASGVHSIGRVTAPTISAAIDWVWWAGTRKYQAKFVVPAEQQADRKSRAILLMLEQEGLTSGPIPSPETSRHAQPWEDESTDSQLLGRTGALLARSDTVSAMRIARNPHTPPTVLARMVKSPSLAVRWQLAGNPATPANAIAALRASADFGVRWYLASRPETPTADVIEWAKEDPALWTAAVERPDAASAALQQLLDASSGALRYAIARRQATIS